MKLTEKQKRFVDFYIKTGNATQSYIDAGYSATSRKVAEANARRLLANDSVKKWIEQRLKQLEDQRIADAAEVMRFLTSAMRGEIQEEVVVVESVGDFQSEARIVKKEVSAKERIKAAELLAKRYGLLVERQQVDVQGAVQIVDDVPRDEA